MDDKVKVLLQIEIPRLNEDVDIASIRKYGSRKQNMA